MLLLGGLECWPCPCSPQQAVAQLLCKSQVAIGLCQGIPHLQWRV